MEIISRAIVFFIVLFVYIHVFFHVKTSNDLEVYDIDQKPSKEKLEELADIRQPVIMKYNNENILTTFTTENIANQYGAFDLNIRNNKISDETLEKYIILTFNTAQQLLSKTENNKYYSENNETFLTETSLIKTLQSNDLYLRPYMVSSCKYDLLLGTNTTTPLKYDLAYRHYIYITEGEATIKLTPPKNSRYLYRESDYEMFEFRSPVDPWNVQERYKSEFNKIKFLELKLKRGDIIFIPAYWWYSIKFTTKTVAVSMKYITYMNTISITPQLTVHYLQTMNVKFNTQKTINETNIKRINTETPIPNQEPNETEQPEQTK
jgi:hypothetical protein